MAGDTVLALASVGLSLRDGDSDGDSRRSGVMTFCPWTMSVMRQCDEVRGGCLGSLCVLEWSSCGEVNFLRVLRLDVFLRLDVLGLVSSS